MLFLIQFMWWLLVRNFAANERKIVKNNFCSDIGILKSCSLRVVYPLHINGTQYENVYLDFVYCLICTLKKNIYI